MPLSPPYPQCRDRHYRDPEAVNSSDSAVRARQVQGPSSCPTVVSGGLSWSEWVAPGRLFTGPIFAPPDINQALASGLGLLEASPEAFGSKRPPLTHYNMSLDMQEVY